MPRRPINCAEVPRSWKPSGISGSHRPKERQFSMRAIPVTLRSLVVMAAFVTLIMSNAGSLALKFQVAGVGVLCFAAAICLVTGRVRMQGLTLFDWLMMTTVVFSFAA